MARKIARETVIGGLLAEYPELTDIFHQHGMNCDACMAASFETIESGAAMYRIDLDKLLEELNDIISKDNRVG